MRRVVLASAALTALVLVVAASAATGPTSLRAAPMSRFPFPERGYVIDLPSAAVVGRDQVSVEENGQPVGDFAFDALSSSGLRYGAILAIDTSDSMRGAPEAAAQSAARTFVARRALNEAIGLVAFNSRVTVVQEPTVVARNLRRATAKAPRVAYGTRIYDALDRALTVLAAQKLKSGSIILLSDGADVGSRIALARVVAEARTQQVRVFTVGLRSGAFNGATLKSIATETGGSYAEAASTKDLEPIYKSLGSRLAGEYVVQYRSAAAAKAPVHVVISIDGVGRATQSYTAPTPAGLPPFHRSFVSRFLLSGFSLLLLAVVAAALAMFVIRAVLDSARSRVVERMMSFVGTSTQEPAEEPKDWKRRTRRGTEQGAFLFGRLRGRIAEQLDIGRIDISPLTVIWLTLAATVVAFFVLSLVSSIVALLALATPLASRALIRRKVRKVRAVFADQLPPNLQVLASAMRAGHSFIGAFSSCVSHAQEPSKSELGRAISDEQLGMQMDDAIRRVSVRMASRDLEQVALLAELQLTTGGNAAEVLDVVVGTLRERADIRRLVRTLTAQGRMARIILTALPVLTGLGFWAIQPNLFSPFAHSGGGQVAFVVAAVLIGLGSLVIQRIVEIEV